jgi:tetratricopeptide (TPR) repeat protein
MLPSRIESCIQTERLKFVKSRHHRIGAAPQLLGEINGMADRSGIIRAKELQSAIESIQRGDFGKAEKQLLRITTREPNSFNANHMLGVVYTLLNTFERAEKFFKTALSINAKYAPLYKNYGFLLTRTKRFDEAIEQLNIALRLLPNFALAYSDRGNALEKLNRLDEAIADYNHAIALAPEMFGFYNNRGIAFLRKKQFSEAQSDFKRAIELNPNFADAYSGHGDVLEVLKRYDEALADYDKALSLNPDLENAWLGRGNALVGLRRYDDALAAYERALWIKSDLAAAWLGRGNVYSDLKWYDEAFSAYDKALSIAPALVEAYHSQANTFFALSRNGEALNSLNRAIELDPKDPQARFSRSLVLLTLGQYADAWEEYEWRKRLLVPIADRTFTKPPLLDLEGVEGATVFVYGEQGLGDYIHFCRYVKLVSDRGAKVVLEAPKSLFQLFKSLNGVSKIIEADQSVPPFDYHCPLMSLPRVFQTTLDNVPNEVPYLFAELDKVQAWARKLGAKSKLRIGLVWSGGFLPNQPETWSTKERRNIPLARLAKFKDLDATFYSLQKGERASAEFKELLRRDWDGPAIIDWTDEIHDFSDTAALIQNLDLVISVDTSTAHLAGAMAKPVWLLNRFDIEWRWLPNSPWYPTARLFRQQAPGNWLSVIDRLMPELEKLVQVYDARALGSFNC